MFAQKSKSKQKYEKTMQERETNGKSCHCVARLASQGSLEKNPFSPLNPNF